MSGPGEVPERRLPEAAETYRKWLECDPDNQQAMVMLVLALSDQFATGGDEEARRLGVNHARIVVIDGMLLDPRIDATDPPDVVQSADGFSRPIGDRCRAGAPGPV